jgi:hypothetical protein
VKAESTIHREAKATAPVLDSTRQITHWRLAPKRLGLSAGLAPVSSLSANFPDLTRLATVVRFGTVSRIRSRSVSAQQ